jgi:hypothetical protein
MCESWPVVGVVLQVALEGFAAWVYKLVLVVGIIILGALQALRTWRAHWLWADES